MEEANEPESTIQEQPVSVQKTPQSSSLLLGIIIGFLITVAGFSGYYFLSQKSSSAPSTIMIQPSTTPDPTANWKTYTNTQYNYSIKYPEDLIVEPNGYAEGGKDIEIAEGISIQTKSNGLDKPLLKLYVLKPENYSSKFDSVEKLLSWTYEENSKNPNSFIRLIEPIHKTSFNGMDAYAYTQESKGIFSGWEEFMAATGRIEFIGFKQNGNYFLIVYHQTSPFNQILSTFRFTQDLADQTADWKTYTSTKYNFSIQYPLSFNVSDESEGVIIFHSGSNVCAAMSLAINLNGNNGRCGSLAYKGTTTKIIPSPYSIGGISTTRHDDYIGDQVLESRFDTIAYKSNTYYIDYYNGGNSVEEINGRRALLDQVLSTLKFF